MTTLRKSSPSDPDESPSEPPVLAFFAGGVIMAAATFFFFLPGTPSSSKPSPAEPAKLRIASTLTRARLEAQPTTSSKLPL
eukprot:11745678-Alexandrium_andersonii.AAC.1